MHNMAEITSYHAGTSDGPLTVNYHILLYVIVHYSILVYNIRCCYILLYLPGPGALRQPPASWTGARLRHGVSLPQPDALCSGPGCPLDAKQ